MQMQAGVSVQMQAGVSAQMQAGVSVHPQLTVTQLPKQVLAAPAEDGLPVLLPENDSDLPAPVRCDAAPAFVRDVPSPSYCFAGEIPE